MQEAYNTLRRAILGFLVACASPPALAASAAPPLQVFKTPWCGCCSDWVSRMREAGFAKVTITEMEDLGPKRRALGISDSYSSCHTGLIQGHA